MGNQLCEQCQQSRNPIDPPLSINHHPDAPLPQFAYQREITYEIPCEVNHIYPDLIQKVEYEPLGIRNQEESQSIEDLRGTQFKQSYFIQPYSVFYTGQWKAGKPHGKGEIILKDGSVVNGTFYKGTVRGKKCLYIMKEGSYYLGRFEDNNFEGYGEFVTPKGHKYQGNWQKSIPNGKGIEYLQNGDKYQGNFQNGIKKGQNCQYQWKDHDYYRYYQGGFSDNYFSGKGRLVLKNGDEIRGYFTEGKIQNAHLKNDQVEYEGDILMGKFSGKGKIKFLNQNKVYQGQFKDGVIHGQGILSENGGKQKKGEWFRGIYIRQSQNINEQEMDKLIKTINTIFSQQKYIQKAVKNLQEQIKTFSEKKHEKSYQVSEITQKDVQKIKSHKYCVIQVSGVYVCIQE